MAKKFLTDINIAAGVYDSSGDIGNSGQVLSSTGSGVNWINTTTSASIIYQDGFTGDGSTTAFTLANSLDNENKTQVYIEGVYQHKDNYSLNGATLTFSSAPPDTSDIEVISFGSVTAADDILYDDDFTSAGLMTTDGSGVYSITTNNSSNWNTAYTHSQAAHAPANAEQNVQSDWTATSGDSFIQNKPTIPSGNQIIDWTADQGSTEIHSGNYINTTYTVGDGGLTQNNFTNALKTKLDGIEASADVTDTANVTAAGALMDSELTDLAGVKAVTISDLATETYVDTAVSNLVDSSPATLDTLNELAAALGDDPNFATTTATSIGTKLPLAGGTLTGDLNMVQTSGNNLIYINSSGGGAPVIYLEDSTVKWGQFVSSGSFYIKNETTAVDVLTLSGSNATFGGNINTTGQFVTTLANGFRVDSGGYARIELDSNSNWSYIRYQNNSTVSWDVAVYQGGQYELRPGGSGTNSWTYSSAGHATAGASSRAPIFYDSNDTNYYLDPNAQSGATSFYTKGDIEQTNIANSTWPYLFTTSGASNSNASGFWTSNVGYPDMRLRRNNSTVRALISSWERSYTSNGFNDSSDMRAPLFYDLNDTNYYLDPALTGKSLKIAGGISTNVANGDVIIKHTVSEGNSWLFQENAANWGLFWLNESANGTAFGSYTTVGAEFIGFRNGSQTGFKNPSAWTGINSAAYAGWLLSNYSGYFWTASTQYSETDMRAPIFYDANNTSYYVDPASTSILNRVEINDNLDVRAQLGTWITSDVMGDAIGWNSSYGVYIGSNVGGTHYLRGNGTFTTGGNTYNLWHSGNDTGLLVKGTAIFANAVADDTSGPLNFNRSTGWDEYIIKHGTSKGMFGKKGIGWHMNSANSFHILSTGWTANFGVEHGGSCRAAGDFRAPIFYDSGNTGFYINADSTSNLYNLELSGAKHTYLYITPGNGYEAMVRFNGGQGSTWYVGKRTTTQLLGTQDACHFYSQTAGQTVGGYSTTGHHYAVSSSRAPIFYDQNNTGYYTNPASTSVLNGLQFGFTQHGSANNIRMGNSTTMNAISSGTNNAAFGVEALGNCSSGSRNFAYGYAALFSVSSGGSNIAMGDACGYNVTSGSNNLLFGQNAGRTGYQSPYQSIAGVTSGSNQIHMGNESHSTARIQISWTVNSDARDKTDVTPINVGLDFVKDLNPVTFRWDKRSSYEDRTPTGENKLEELTLGFLAQEVEEVEKSYGYDVANKTNLVVDRDVEQDHFGITYEKMIPILTKAIQELEARVKELENN
jgi:hypothetical protein